MYFNHPQQCYIASNPSIEYMSIEKEIHQPHFRNSFQKVSVNLLFTSNWLQEKIRLFLDGYGITSQQYNILRILRGSKGPLSTLQIRERMLDKMSDSSRMVDRLVNKGWVIKKTCCNDKRLVDVTISENGMALLAQIDTHQASLDAIASSLTEQEAELLSNLLDKLREGNSAT